MELVRQVNSRIINPLFYEDTPYFFKPVYHSIVKLQAQSIAMPARYIPDIHSLCSLTCLYLDSETQLSRRRVRGI